MFLSQQILTSLTSAHQGLSTDEHLTTDDLIQNKQITKPGSPLQQKGTCRQVIAHRAMRAHTQFLVIICARFIGPELETQGAKQRATPAAPPRASLQHR